MIQVRRKTSVDIKTRKGGDKIAVLTAYTAPIAHLADNHVDVLMVGDSLGMVVYGMPSTLGVTLDMMIAHGRAVVNASSQALALVDMPFGAYQESPEQAFRAAARVIAETGCGAIKLEGGVEMAPTIRFLALRGIPVMGHVGLMPQHMNVLGGFRAQGREPEKAKRILQDALAVQEAGAFAVVLESIPEALARDITKKLRIPTIGIGASPACDGQVLVVDDMLGITENPPRFVKQFGTIGKQMESAVRAYVKDVKNGAFPAAEHCLGSTPTPQELKRKKK